MSLLYPLLLLAQIGPYTPAGTPGGPALPQGIERPKRVKSAPAPVALPVPKGKAGACHEMVSSNPADAVDFAQDWAAGAKADERADAQACLGMAHAARSEWGDAATAFTAARDASGNDRMARQRYGAMVGNAALAAGDAARALEALKLAHDDAAGLAEPALTGEIALDQARALVTLGRLPEAELALAEAQSSLPQSSDTWLLSATLARKLGKLTQAQGFIIKAGDLGSRDPAVGLEAGVIAMLSGHETAARKSWKSVIDAAPDSTEAQKAKAYIDQIGPEEKPAAPPGK